MGRPSGHTDLWGSGSAPSFSVHDGKRAAQLQGDTDLLSPFSMTGGWRGVKFTSGHSKWWGQQSGTGAFSWECVRPLPCAHVRPFHSGGCWEDEQALAAVAGPLGCLPASHIVTIEISKPTRMS